MNLFQLRKYFLRKRKEEEGRKVHCILKLLRQTPYVKYFIYFWIREAVKKKIAEKETLVHMGGRGVKKSPFLAHQKGDLFLWREGSKSFCHMSHVLFGVSVSTLFVAFFEALHNVNFLYHVIKYLT